LNGVLTYILSGIEMSENLVDHELNNWARWCRSGPELGPILPGSFLDGMVVPNILTGEDADDRGPPIHEDRAKRVQKIFDVAITIERKILQAEYVSPWQYARYSGGIAAAVRRINDIEPSIKLSVTGYETILASIKRRVARVFQ
jgi:hypothetical protein